jgi:hypothetical protein
MGGANFSTSRTSNHATLVQASFSDLDGRAAGPGASAILSLVPSFRLIAASGSLKAFSIRTIVLIIKSIIAGHWSRLKMFPAISDLMRQARLPSSGSQIRSPPNAA